MESMMKKDEVFTTSDGRKIPLNYDFYDYAKDVIGLPKGVSQDFELAASNTTGGADAMDYEKAKVLGSSKARLSNAAYAARWSPTYLFKTLLEGAGIHQSFKTMLDIGCGYALQPRMIKALGITEHCTAIDLYDRASMIDEDYLRRQHGRMRWYGLIDKLQERIIRKPFEKMSNLERAILYKINTPRRSMRTPRGYLSSREIFRTPLKQKAHLDELIIGNVYDVDRRFELITAFSSAEWFKMDELFAKVSDMLEDGGVFYLFVANYWHAGTAGRIFGHFPFLTQRLSKEDFKRYLEQYFPDQTEAWEKAYEFFDPTHPTLHDYVDCATKHGMYPISQFSPVAGSGFSHKYAVTTRGWLEMEPHAVESALADIRKTRPDIRYSDLLPLTHHVLFRKVSPDRKATKADFAKLKGPFHDFHYRPTNPVMKKLRSLAIKLNSGK